MHSASFEVDEIMGVPHFIYAMNYVPFVALLSLTLLPLVCPDEVK